MRADGVLAVALLIAGSVVVAIGRRRRARRSDAPASTVMEPPPARRRSRLWTSWLATVRFPEALSYWYPMMGVYHAPSASALPEVWDHAQLMFVTHDHDELVLDFLVPRVDSTQRRPTSTSVPVTIHAHQLPTRQSETDLQRAIGAWITTSAFVDIELRHGGDSNLVCIHERQSFVTLELLSTSGPD